MKPPKVDSTVWDLKHIFVSDLDPRIVAKRKLVEKESDLFIKKWKKRTDYLSSATVLSEALKEYESWIRNFGAYNDELYYFSLRTAADQLDTDLKAKLNQAISRATKIQNEIQFFSLQLAKVNRTTQKKFLESAKLSSFKHYLEQLFRNSQYLLSDPEEKIINLKSETSHSGWVQMLEAFLSKEERTVLDLDGKKSTKPFSDFLSLLTSNKKKIRDTAAIAINDCLNKYSDVAEHEINAILANKKVDDELRGFTRPDQSSVLGDDLDIKIVDRLTKVVSDRFDISRRWYHLKARLLKVEKLDYQDRIAQLGSSTKKYPYKESVKLVFTVLNKLSPDFGSIFRQFVENNQIDVYPKKGKADGAFCAAGSLTSPTYILLNHTGNYRDCLTLAHEVGHGINDELMKRNVSALNFGSPLSTAEVASTFMEDFVNAELLLDATPNERLALLVKKMDDEVATIFRQVACYQFEAELHKEFRAKGYLNKKEIGAIFRKHMSDYMGDSVIQSEGSENWWIYWGHIRRFFYVYSYASGLLISKSLQAKVKADPKFIDKVTEFLSSGSSSSPEVLFKRLGLDISKPAFWSAGLEELETLLGEIEVLALKLKKI